MRFLDARARPRLIPADTQHDRASNLHPRYRRLRRSRFGGNEFGNPGPHRKTHSQRLRQNGVRLPGLFAMGSPLLQELTFWPSSIGIWRALVATWLVFALLNLNSYSIHGALRPIARPSSLIALATSS